MAVAFMANAQTLIYRADILEQAGLEVPTSYEDMLAGAKVIREKGLMEYPLGGAYQAGTTPYPMVPYQGLPHTALGAELPDFLQGKDVKLASWPSYSLTTVHQPSKHMVDDTVNTLMESIKEGRTLPRRVEIAGPLMIRRSARIPPDWSNTIGSKINSSKTGRDVPQEQVRLHICWGNYEGPHVCDVDMNTVLRTLMST